MIIEDLQYIQEHTSDLNPTTAKEFGWVANFISYARVLGVVNDDPR